MTSKDMSALLQTFENRLRELKAEVNTVAEALCAPDNPDVEDRATENEEDEVLEERGKVAQLEIEQIEAAISRVELGTYGDCTHCGEPILAPRLKALPYAAHCINCANDEEENTVSI